MKGHAVKLRDHRGADTMWRLDVRGGQEATLSTGKRGVREKRNPTRGGEHGRRPFREAPVDAEI